MPMIVEIAAILWILSVIVTAGLVEMASFTSIVELLGSTLRSISFPFDLKRMTRQRIYPRSPVE